MKNNEHPLSKLLGLPKPKKPADKWATFGVEARSERGDRPKNRKREIFRLTAAERFQPGDLVHLHTGSPVMAVAKVEGNDVTCQWEYNGQPKMTNPIPSEKLAHYWRP